MGRLQQIEPLFPSSQPPTPSVRRHRISVLFAVTCWIYAIWILALCILLRAGDEWWPATLLMFSPRWWTAFPVVVLLPAAVLWRRRSLTPLLIALLLIAAPLMGFSIPWQRFFTQTPSRPRLRLLTCNMHYHRSHSTALLHLLSEARPDIVAVQEWREEDPSAYFPKSEWHTREAHGLFLASRGVIRSAQRLGRNSMRQRGSVMRYELETSAGTITFFNLHLASPREGLYEVIHQPHTGIAELRAGSDLRGEQFENLSLEADDVSGPLLLAGDFNTPPESALFRDVWGSYHDVFAEAGWGWGYTFLGHRTTVRIDHILTGPGWYCPRCWVGPNVGSPHRPVLADLIWMGDDGEHE